MLDSDLKVPIPAVDLQHAVTDIIESIAMEDASLGKILAAENEILEKSKKDPGDVQMFVSVNESVSSIVKNISMLKLLMQYELEDTEKLLQQAEDLSDNDEFEE